eukprot:364991-Chlamydomonas_euryale.AAC.13
MPCAAEMCVRSRDADAGCAKCGILATAPVHLLAVQWGCGKSNMKFKRTRPLRILGTRPLQV